MRLNSRQLAFLIPSSLRLARSRVSKRGNTAPSEHTGDTCIPAIRVAADAIVALCPVHAISRGNHFTLLVRQPTRSKIHVDSPIPLLTRMHPGKRSVSSGRWLITPTIRSPS